VLNQQLNESYYAYVNHFRLEEFKRLIDEGEYKRYTVTALSERCGFKRTSFFSTFRKVEGMTPAEYLKTKNIRTTL
jgi:AraC-like DNA-binding protein